MSPDASDEREGTQDAEPRLAAPRRRSAWKTGLLILSSAALGGWAAAVWHRRALQHLRAGTDLPPAADTRTEDDAIF